MPRDLRAVGSGFRRLGRKGPSRKRGQQTWKSRGQEQVMLRRLKEAAEQGEPPRLWGTRSGMRRRGCLQCVWEELAAFIPSRRLSKRKAIEFTSLLQNKDHKETNTVRAGGMLAEAPEAMSSWCCGRSRWHQTSSRFASSLFPEGLVCLRLTVLGTLSRKHLGDRNHYSLSPGGMLAFPQT